LAVEKQNLIESCK